MRPHLVLACYPGLELFGADDLERLSSVAELLDPVPIGDSSDPRTDGLLGRAEVILGHWGCPPIDAAVLDRAPKLGLFAYAAETIKATRPP